MFLWESIAFGPIQSRRFGKSLGINLLPTSQKICSFNCVYCECGWTKCAEIDRDYYCTPTIILEAIETKLLSCSEQKIEIDSITFSGNGEPTLHPDFAKIIDGIIDLRNTYYPDSIITCLSNATQLHRKDVFDALQKIENPVLKLDAGSEKMFKLIDTPQDESSLKEIISNLKSFPKKFTLQTLLLKGKGDGIEVNNCEGDELELLISHIKDINPTHVMLYSLDRETPAKNLIKLDLLTLENIANRIRIFGIDVSVY
ncbi:MAG: radical SAM protein [Bacteroidales bacterium]|jgi:wyosine [tRNA(Phe)-imidazoG37] synthetase (radical SAM superfamily)|nr:radical SAM protein [Bacteroidales bacterium]